MRKSLLLFLALLTMAFYRSSYAQIPNASFEDWTNNGSYEMPDDYFTSDEEYTAISVFFPSITYPSSIDKVAGRTGYAISVKNVEESLSGTVQDTVPGYGALIDFNSGNNGMPYTQRPTALTGYYKFTQGAPGSSPTKDTARVYVYLIKSAGAGVDGDSIGGGSLDIYLDASSWTSFSIPISYTDASNPDTLYFGFFSSIQVEDDPYVDEYTIHPETELVLDDIALTTVTGQKIPLLSQSIVAYPNPAGEYFYIKNIPKEAALIEVMDYTGSRIKSMPVSPGLQTINTSEFTPGLYHYRISDVNGEIIYMSTINIVK